MKSVQKKYNSVIGGVAIVLIAVLLFFRLKYGFDQTDESYYYALAKRFYQGDIPFIHEWYPSQIFAVMLYPFYGLYNIFEPGSEGIILAGRYVYLVIQIIVAVFALYVFRDDYPKSIVISVLYMMCTRQNIAGLSYYNLYLTSCFVISIFLYHYMKHEANAKVSFLMIGICSSVATLCMPYFALFALGLTLVLLLKKKNGELATLVTGILACAIIYIFFLLSRASVTDYIESIGYVLSNPDYADLSILKKITGTILSIGKLCIIEVPGFMCILFDKSQKRKGIVFVASLLFGALVFGLSTPGAIYIQFSFLALPFIISITHKKDELKTEQKIGGILYYLGLLFAFLFWLGSDTEASCLPLGLLVSVIGVILVMQIHMAEKLTSLVFFILCVCAISARFLGPCYRDANILQLNQKILTGPAKGLFTEKSDADDYNLVMDMIVSLNQENISANVENKILFSRFLPWAYLVSDYRNASMTPWRTSISDERLELYYEVNPEQFPNLIVILDENIGETNGLSGGERMNAGNIREGKLWNLLQSAGEIHSYEAGTVYYFDASN